MMLQIEDGIPIPDQHMGRPAIYPFGKLAVGQSFLIPGKRPSGLMTIAGRWNKRTGRRFISKTVEGGTRVWRVE